MKLSKAHPIRKVVREILASAFWFHAIYAFHIIPQGRFEIFSISSRYIYNASLIGLIFYYSYFSDRGWFSVLYDLFYIYFWPFITAFRCMWLASKSGYKFLKSRTVISPPKLIIKPIKKNDEVPGTLKTLTADASPAGEKPSNTKQLWKPFVQFNLLWALLILTIDNKAFICVASAIALIGAARAMYILWNLFADTSSWIEKLKGNFASQMANKIAAVRTWEEGLDSENLTTEVNSLKFWESAFSFIDDNRNILAKFTIAVAACITIPFYCYVSLLFSLAYFGISKIESIHWSWPHALTTSLYMPFAFTNLPQSFPIQLVGGLQAISVTIMGWNIVLRNLSSKFDRIANAAMELRGPFEDHTYRQKLQMFTDMASVRETAPRPAKAPPVKKEPRGSLRKPPKKSR